VISATGATGPRTGSNQNRLRSVRGALVTQALECGDIEPEARAGMAHRVGELWLHIGHLQGAAVTLGAVVSCHRGTERYVSIDTIVQ
jgi:hypothetical protein